MDGSGKGWAASGARFELLLLVFSLLIFCRVISSAVTGIEYVLVSNLHMRVSH